MLSSRCISLTKATIRTEQNFRTEQMKCSPCILSFEASLSNGSLLYCVALLNGWLDVHSLFSRHLLFITFLSHTKRAHALIMTWKDVIVSCSSRVHFLFILMALKQANQSKRTVVCQTSRPTCIHILRFLLLLSIIYVHVHVWACFIWIVHSPRTSPCLWFSSSHFQAREWKEMEKITSCLSINGHAKQMKLNWALVEQNKERSSSAWNEWQSGLA